MTSTLSRRHFIKTFLIGVSYLALPPLVFSQSTQSLIIRTGLLNKTPQRILSAGFVSDLLLMALSPEKMVGIATDLKPQSKKFLSEQIQNLPHIGRIAGRASTAPVEKIISLNADLILDVGSVSETFLSTAEKISQQTHLPYFILSGKLADSAQQFTELGELLQVQTRAKALAELANEILSKTHQLCATDNTKAYLGRGADGLETALKGAIHTEVLDWLGVQNVAEGAGEKKLARVSMEQLFQWQPDLILTQDANFYQRTQQDPLWQALTAVKNQRVFLAPSLPFNWLDSPPSVNRLLGCVWLAHQLKPEALPQATAYALVQRYFRLFYGYAISPSEITALFGNN
ncbi:iron ABC transporter substrate-binding protein [Lonepinella sp. BR2474]|uniref:iron ABC transporter substrate-binding protein n=1 Tax=Lonepinella sp. BR2474 TaxID=3434548 RepID=UPI003F6E33CF